jgi:hypothetical protein
VFLEEHGMTDSVLYAMTDDGERLPVIDVSNPAFAVVMSEEEVAALTDPLVVPTTLGVAADALDRRICRIFSDLPA